MKTFGFIKGIRQSGNISKRKPEIFRNCLKFELKTKIKEITPALKDDFLIFRLLFRFGVIRKIKLSKI